LGRKRLTPAERETALAELKAGGTVTGVAAAMSVGRDTVRKVRDSAVRSDRAVTSAAQPIAARVSPAEMQAFDAVIGRAGYRSRSEGLRALVRMSAGFLELSREENAELDALTVELGKIGVNINQIARLANSGRLKIVKSGELEALWELHRELRKIRSFLGQMNTERRRRGVALFEAAAREAQRAREDGDG
jgi:hypothetical protein